MDTMLMTPLGLPNAVVCLPECGAEWRERPCDRVRFFQLGLHHWGSHMLIWSVAAHGCTEEAILSGIK